MWRSYNATDWDYVDSSNSKETSGLNNVAENAWIGKGDMDAKFQQNRLSGRQDPSLGRVRELIKSVRMPVRHTFCTDYSSRSLSLGLNICLEKA